MKVTITATVAAIQQNTSYLQCSGTMKFDCSKAQVKGEWYLEPYLCMEGTCYRKVITSTNPGKIQVVEVENDGIVYFLRATLANYTDACNACCGLTPTLAPTDLPVWVADGCICANTAGNYIFKWRIRPVLTPQTFTLSIFINSVAGSPATSPVLTTAAGALAYAQTHWQAYGTWTLEGDNADILVLTTTSQPCVILTQAFSSLDFCISPVFPLTFDTVTRDDGNGGTASYALPNGAVTVADNVALQAALTTPVNYFSDGVLTHAVSGKVQYYGSGTPGLLKLAGATVGTWSNISCS